MYLAANKMNYLEVCKHRLGAKGFRMNIYDKKHICPQCLIDEVEKLPLSIVQIRHLLTRPLTEKRNFDQFCSWSFYCTWSCELEPCCERVNPFAELLGFGAKQTVDRKLLIVRRWEKLLHLTWPFWERIPSLFGESLSSGAKPPHNRRARKSRFCRWF